ncbi:hypothetical protein Tco_0022778 [Tanacetum coccineum]
MSRDSHVTYSVLDNSKKAAKNVAVYVRKNKQTDNTSANVIPNKENVIDDDVANASKAKTLLCVSCMKNVLIPCHDKCVAKHKLNVRSNVRTTFSTNSRSPKSSKTNFVASKTRFSEKKTQSKTLDTTLVESASKAKDKVVQIVLWVVDSGCSKHMTGDRSLLRNSWAPFALEMIILQQSQAMAIIYMAISLFVMYIMLKVLDITSLAMDNFVMEI